MSVIHLCTSLKMVRCRSIPLRWNMKIICVGRVTPGGIVDTIDYSRLIE